MLLSWRSLGVCAAPLGSDISVPATLSINRLPFAMALLEQVMHILATVLFQELTESTSRLRAMVSKHQTLQNQHCDITAFKTTICELYYWDYEPVVERLSVLNHDWDPNTNLVSRDMCSYFEIMIRTCRATRRHSLSFQSRGYARFLGRMHHLRCTWEQLRQVLCNLHSSIMAMFCAAIAAFRLS